MREMTDDTCTACGKVDLGIGWFGPAYRRNEIRHGRPDPGNLCGACAGKITGRRIVAELEERKP